MEKSEKQSAGIRAAVALLITAIVIYRDPIGDTGFAVFLYPLIAATIYLWLGVAFFFIDIIWKLIAKPEERLFATIMLGSTLFVTAALLAAYWLIRDSIGVGATIMYAIGAYAVFAIVRWFRRHTASYYAQLEADKTQEDAATNEQN